MTKVVLMVVMAAMGLLAFYGLRSAEAQGDKKPETGPSTGPSTRPGKVEKVIKSDEAWKKDLTPMQYHVLREKGTERAFTGELWNHHGKGTYVCAACGLELFTSETKFDSGCGWPSFYQAKEKGFIDEHIDKTHGMVRTEVTCSRCDGHLGHVFNDGPRDKTGLRYCINSASIKFVPAKEEKKDPK